MRDELGIGPAQPLLVMLPGSRASEVTRLAPVFAEVARRLRADIPDLAVVIPAAAPVSGLTSDLFPSDSSGWPKVLDPNGHDPAGAERRKRAVMAAADVALAASGTVSLELAAAGVPMVIAYSMNWISSRLAPLFVKLDTVTLVNIVTGTRTVPEFLLKDCNAERITPAVARLLADAGEVAGQREAGDRAMVLLGRGGDPPGLRAARSVLSAIGR
jgi:lipid-A-disaccharide synthase